MYELIETRAFLSIFPQVQTLFIRKDKDFRKLVRMFIQYFIYKFS